jgi:hypothetical protein
MTLHELIPVLQVAIGPVILISGVGLLLLSMTNRFGRVIDRTRQLVEAWQRAPELHAARAAQLAILAKRARLIRAAIALAAVSALLAALLIITLFLAAWQRFDSAWPVVGLFMACLGALIGALVCFIMDINVSLAALQLEIESSPSKQVNRD